MAAFWYQILLSPICSCIYFQIWFYFTWLHLFTPKVLLHEIHIYTLTSRTKSISSNQVCVYNNVHDTNYSQLPTITQPLCVSDYSWSLVLLMYSEAKWEFYSRHVRTCVEITQVWFVSCIINECQQWWSPTLNFVATYATSVKKRKAIRYH